MARELISIVIPVLNEAANLRAPGRAADAGARRRSAQAAGSWSSSTTARPTTRSRACGRLNAADARIKAISFSRNFGKEIALAAGIRYANGDAVILMDADLQHPPEVLSQFVARWREGYQVVYGQRIDRNTDSPLRRLVSVAFYKLFNALVKTDIPEGAGDFRLLDRKAVDAMNRMRESVAVQQGAVLLDRLQVDRRALHGGRARGRRRIALERAPPRAFRARWPDLVLDVAAAGLDAARPCRLARRVRSMPS